ncbi:hypothetical protein ACFY8X_38955 [Streptomyces tanashiensis]|uniref:hypothetical protein n=1 Tax=Streptomyces tanashiensis TaxID=67367 RepID=UPI0036ECC605
MSLVTRDPVTGLRRNPIRFPDGNPPTPYGCRWCGTGQSGHGQRWKASVGIHRWELPTRAQVLARMRARRRARLAGPEPLHATTGWAPDHTGESADPYCADCRTDTCARWNRIYDRLQLRRQGLRRWPRADVPF